MSFFCLVSSFGSLSFQIYPWISLSLHLAQRCWDWQFLCIVHHLSLSWQEICFLGSFTPKSSYWASVESLWTLDLPLQKGMSFFQLFFHERYIDGLAFYCFFSKLFFSYLLRLDFFVLVSACWLISLTCRWAIVGVDLYGAEMIIIMNKVTRHILLQKNPW